jgi:hypothetical protein
VFFFEKLPELPQNHMGSAGSSGGKFIKEDSMASLKKSLVFGCAVLLTALLFITGCPSPSSSDIFVPVTDITGVPSGGTAGAEVDLSGATVVPADADYKSISWSVKDAGITGLSAEGIVNARFTPPEPGILVLTAVIPNGMAEGIAYTKDFALTINAIQLPARVSGVSLFAGESMLGVAWSAVSGATSYEVYYSDTATPPASPDQTVTGTVFADITGLTNDTPYNVWIKAKNNLGVSDFSEMESGTPAAPVLGNLVGTWVDGSWGSVLFIKADGTYEDWYYSYDNDGGLWIGDPYLGDQGGQSYSGQIVATTDATQNEGYIYIRYTYNYSYPDVVGNYYAIYWKDKAVPIPSGTIKTSGSSELNGRPTLAEAKQEYTVANSYFEYDTSFLLFEYGPDVSALAGKWKATSNILSGSYAASWVTIDNSSFPPTFEQWVDQDGDGVLETSDGDMIYITGVIKGTKILSGNSGYIFIKSTDTDSSIIEEKYYRAILWDTYNGSTVNLGESDTDEDYFTGLLSITGSDFDADYKYSYTRK